MFQRRLAMLFLTTILLLSALALPAAAEADAPCITLSYVPPYGTDKTLTGCVTGGADFDPADYCLSLGLQIQSGWETYLKPLDVRPYETLGSSGAFSYWFTSGTGDENARVLTLWLVPMSYVQPFIDGGSFVGYNPQSAAVDTVTILRDPDGSVTLSPDRYVAEPNALSSNITVSDSKIAVDVGFYTEEGTRPGDDLSDEHVDAVLDTAAGIADTVRYYSASGAIEKAYAAAAAKGLKVVGTAYLTSDREANQQEMDALIQHCKNGYVSLAIVGNEVLLRGDLTRDELIADIEYVRSAIAGTGVPVTTSDSLNFFTESPDLRRAVDVYAPNVYPYWSGVKEADAAVEAFENSLSTLQSLSGDKQIIISETMLPTGDDSGDLSAEAAAYMDGIRAWSKETGIPVLYFELADEPFKTEEEGAPGSHWGIFNSDLTMKESYSASTTLREVARIAACATLPEDLTEIGDQAFQNCADLEGLYVPSCVTSISEHAFDGCENLFFVCAADSYAREYAEAHGITWYTPA